MEQFYITSGEQIAQISNVELFNPTHINIAYFFSLIANAILAFIKWLLSLILLLFRDLESIKYIFWFLALILFIFLVYMFWRHYKIRYSEEVEYGELEQKKFYEISEDTRNKRWVQVLDYIDSLNESDWRLGIMEADSMLEEMLTSMRLEGDSIGEKLKTVEKSDFNTLDQAWEAHKVRNRIAHDGAVFELTKREVVRITSLYKEVFEEFGYI